MDLFIPLTISVVQIALLLSEQTNSYADWQKSMDFETQMTRQLR